MKNISQKAALFIVALFTVQHVFPLTQDERDQILQEFDGLRICVTSTGTWTEIPTEPCDPNRKWVQLRLVEDYLGNKHIQIFTLGKTPTKDNPEGRIYFSGFTVPTYTANHTQDEFRNIVANLIIQTLNRDYVRILGKAALPTE